MITDGSAAGCRGGGGLVFAATPAYPPPPISIAVRRLFFLLGVVLCLSCGSDDELVVVKIVLESATVEEQSRIGEALRELAADYWALSDPAARPATHAYLDRLFQLLVVHPALQRRTAFDWRLHVLIDDLSQEAFGFPGGQVFVTTGLLRLLESEDQLLAVLAHEMAYLDADLAVDRLLGDKAIGGDRLGDLVIDQTPADPAALLANIRAIDHAPATVQLADSVMLDLLCPFNYRPTGLADLYVLADAQAEQPRWLARRPADRTARIDWLYAAAFDCELNGVRNAAAYAAFLENL